MGWSDPGFSAWEQGEWLSPHDHISRMLVKVTGPWPGTTLQMAGSDQKLERAEGMRENGMAFIPHPENSCHTRF